MIVVSLALVHVGSRPVQMASGSGANIRPTKLAGRAIVQGACDGSGHRCSISSFHLLPAGHGILFLSNSFDDLKAKFIRVASNNGSLIEPASSVVH